MSSEQRTFTIEVKRVGNYYEVVLTYHLEDNQFQFIHTISNVTLMGVLNILMELIDCIATGDIDIDNPLR